MATKWKPLRIPSWTRASAVFHKRRPKRSPDGGQFGPIWWSSRKSVVEGDDQVYVIFGNHDDDSIEIKTYDLADAPEGSWVTSE